MTFYSSVRDASVFPYSAIVSIHVTYSDGSLVRGTGAVVGPNDVLTSAHVIQPEDGLRIRSVEVRPGFDDGQLPFGRFEASHRTWYTVDRDGDGLLTRSDVMRDYALLTVEEPYPIGDVTGWFGLRANAASPYRSIYLESAGYPKGLQTSRYDLDMFRTYGHEYFDGQVIEHDLDNETGLNWAGASGSPFWQTDRGGQYIVAILSTASDATYINGLVFDDIMGWIAQNDEQILRGTSRRDVLEGGFKDDVLYGFRGHDLLKGGRGDDILYGGPGNDKLLGAAGRDTLHGGHGRDTLIGGPGADRLFGGPGADWIDGGPGRDIAAGGAGPDTFWFEKGDGRKNVVRDFDPDLDTIAIGAGARRKSDLAFERQGEDTLLAFADVSVIFEDVSRWQLIRSDFDFV